MDTVPIVELVDVEHESRSGIRIHGATLKIFRGETIAVRGPARSGKTGLLKLLAGVVAPSRGLVRYRGVTVHVECEPHLSLQAGDVAFLSQRPSCMFHLTALEHVMLGLYVRGLRGHAAVERRAMRALASSGLEHKARLRMSRLSPEERRRTLIAEVHAMDPSVVFIDEGYGASIGTLALPHRTLVIAATAELPVRVHRTVVIEDDGSISLEPCARAAA